MGSIRALVIRNPTSRHRARAAVLEDALDIARAAGWDISLVETQFEGHGTDLSRAAAADGVDVVIVNGGDGTINEAINGLAGTDVALGVLPAGTANVWAKEVRIANDPRAAMRQVLTGLRRRVDLGRAGERYFLLMAGIGLDAAIIPRVSPRIKRRFGAISYVLAGMWVAMRTKAWRVAMRLDALPADGSLYWMLVGNTRSYGGLTDITYRALADDGLLDAAVMRRGGAHRLLRDGVLVLLKQHHRSPNIDYVHSRVVEIATPGVPVQVDGELCGATPMRFEVAPGALTVIVPAGAKTKLFIRAPEAARD